MVDIKSEDIFEKLRVIANLLNDENASNARDNILQIMPHFDKNDGAYDELINHLLRQCELLAYIRPERANFEDAFVKEIFKVDVGGERLTLHRPQSKILKKLLNGESLVLSAPTSFGKSFIIDAFIAIKNPKNVVIIVPTIALMDETRRRIQKKFGGKYNVITSANETIFDDNIFIFPQERAISYLGIMKKIDLLVVDEFYKIQATKTDKRTETLLRAIIKFASISNQRYYLAPNIKHINDNPITKGMEFIETLDFKTVFLSNHEIYKKWDKLKPTSLKEDKKVEALKELLKENIGKSIVYCGNYSQIEKVSKIIKSEDGLPNTKNKLALQFSKWLHKNYIDNWKLPDLVLKGVGIHNGRMHRALAQIQVKLFEEMEDGIDNLVVTSSIIEGVNTAAKNIILWKNLNGGRKLDSFTYKNIIGRAGRSFKYFIGDIYILEKPPETKDTNLAIEVNQEVFPFIDSDTAERTFSSYEVAEIIKKKNDLQKTIGDECYEKFVELNGLNLAKASTIARLVNSVKNDEKFWSKLNVLNSENSNDWSKVIENIFWKTKDYVDHIEDLRDYDFKTVAEFIKIISENWNESTKVLIGNMNILKTRDGSPLDIERYFQLERYLSNSLSNLLSDINKICSTIHRERIDFSKFCTKLSNAFLPQNVYKLEELGLPRCISRKIQNSNLIDLEIERPLKEVIDNFLELGIDKINNLDSLDEFDKYIINYFFDGITPSPLTHSRIQHPLQ